MLKAKNKLGLIFFPAYDWAISPTHPEREERLLYTQDQLKEEGIFDVEGIVELKPDIATDIDVMRTHFCFPDVESVTTQSHLISAGGAIRAARAVLDGEVSSAFALVRPPGHHSMKCVHGNRGFCNINNEAIMIEYIRENYNIRRIAIVDTDCHHGDGTQDIYWHDPDVLFISLHQDGRTLYPGTGHLRENGGPGAKGRTINIPLPPHTSEEGFLYVIDEMVLPILEDFKPDLIVNSAGQDNHYTDPITNMNFTAKGYAMLNDKLKPHIAVLEGGYSIQGALPYVNLGIVLAMAGIDYSHVKEPDYDIRYHPQDEEITAYIKKLKKEVLNNYFSPMPDYMRASPGEFTVRHKNIYYDTDGIHENQKEQIKTCKNCRGLLVIESSSSVNPPSAGIEIPVDGCSKCKKEGYALMEKMWKSREFVTIQMTDRVDKRYFRYSQY
ncbi:MAG: Histone deacetylase-like amidohydrolase [Spirochaetes bacterium ADurb.Bin218]|jgi:acetoin utilization deacetylase AcuC-like enzyme|nr:histone deacetylase [Spirochaetota bacterium]OQA99679.1 MAG: Histone deacetylase-like amidohydrolase [Spirochaetes bacterium ADurb.Bin218]HOQ10822.1 histone deacetylase [Spirochaetota bacterium]HOV08187.1 histone deacetylase [Spirochaetota bacterium]HPX91356.1 histone deacetylase [Spirochaetota bacterium]